MLTEEEAREKWCPFARNSMLVENSGPPRVLAVTAVNRFEKDGVNGFSNCIGGRCMAWRWGPEEMVDVERRQATERPGDDWYFDALKREWWRAERMKRGFCGLAGSPTP